MSGPIAEVEKPSWETGKVVLDTRGGRKSHDNIDICSFHSKDSMLPLPE